LLDKESKNGLNVYQGLEQQITALFKKVMGLKFLHYFVIWRN
jgi:hypothetical protein